jgi:phenylpropionate dioxygenase-like ring-hydroxylating dioxygenase large terminal subunit
MEGRRGEARSPGLSYQELLDTDSHPVAASMRWESPVFYGDEDVPVERYTSRAFHELEKEKLWSRVWQMACREEELPRVGDTLVYDICDDSILLVRSAPDQIKAYYNACLHRGRQLRSEPGCVHELRCPFHGFCWSLDGALTQIPTPWDFPHLVGEDMSLPEVKVGTWGGFVFINMDPDSEPLEDYLGNLDAHFEKWPLEERFIDAYVSKVMRANWKAVQEAFSEAMHVVTTHPQLLAGIGDANSQYDAWANFDRAMTANCTPSPHIRFEPTEQEMFDAMVDRRLDEPPLAEVPEGMTARQMSGDLSRAALQPALGDKAEDVSDAETLDSIYYTVFPNFHPWGSYQRIVYRFRPNGDDHESSIMDVMLLAPFQGERPPPAKLRHLGPDDSWLEAPELGTLARVFDQDSYNLPKVQRGLKTTRKKGVKLALYQEMKIRHFHTLLGRWLDRAP